MSSVVFKFDSPEEVADIIHHIKHKGTMLELSPMKAGRAGANDNYDQLLVVGDNSEIRRTFAELLGTQWREYIVQGTVEDEKEQA